MSSVKVLQLNSWPLHSMGNTGPILSGQNVTFQFSGWSISINILIVIAIFLGIHNSIFLFKKHRSQPWQHYPQTTLAPINQASWRPSSSLPNLWLLASNGLPSDIAYEPWTPTPLALSALCRPSRHVCMCMFLVKQYLHVWIYWVSGPGLGQGHRGASFPMFAYVLVGYWGREWSCEHPHIPQHGSILWCYPPSSHLPSLFCFGSSGMTMCCNGTNNCQMTSKQTCCWEDWWELVCFEQSLLSQGSQRKPSPWGSGCLCLLRKGFG